MTTASAPQSPGGFFVIRSASLATVIHLGTISFCRRFQAGVQTTPAYQLTNLARQAWQSTLEVVQHQLPDADAEAICLMAAHRRLTALQSEYENLLIDAGALPWGCQTASYMRLTSSTYPPISSLDTCEAPAQTCSRYVSALRERLSFWLEHSGYGETANVMLILSRQCLASLLMAMNNYRQHQVGTALSVMEDWLEVLPGEKLRVASAVPFCQQCGKPMRRYWDQWQCPDAPHGHEAAGQD